MPDLRQPCVICDQLTPGPVNSTVDAWKCPQCSDEAPNTWRVYPAENHHAGEYTTCTFPDVPKKLLVAADDLATLVAFAECCIIEYGNPHEVEALLRLGVQAQVDVSDGEFMAKRYRIGQDAP